MKKENTTLSDSERRRIAKLRNEIIGFIEEEEEYDDYNTDEPSPIDEEPVYDTCKRTEELYILYRNAILRNMN